jgi:hypothetical protein
MIEVRDSSSASLPYVGAYGPALTACQVAWRAPAPIFFSVIQRYSSLLPCCLAFPDPHFSA